MSVTHAQTMEVVCKVLQGQVNPTLVLLLARLGARAIGLSGITGRMVRAHIAGESLGLAGEVESIDPILIETVLAKGYLPVVALLSCGPDESCLSVNEHQVAAHLAGSLQAELLAILSNVAGVCHQKDSVIPTLRLSEHPLLFES